MNNSFSLHTPLRAEDCVISGPLSELAPYWTEEECVAFYDVSNPFYGIAGPFELNGVTNCYAVGTIHPKCHSRIVYSTTMPPQQILDTQLHTDWVTISTELQRVELEQFRATQRNGRDVLALKQGRQVIKRLLEGELVGDELRMIARASAFSEATAIMQLRNARRVARGVAEAARSCPSDRIVGYRRTARDKWDEEKAIGIHRIIAPIMYANYRMHSKSRQLRITFAVEPDCHTIRYPGIPHKVSNNKGAFYVSQVGRTLHSLTLPPDWLSSVHAQGLADINGQVCLQAEARGKVLGYPAWLTYMAKPGSGFSISKAIRAVALVEGYFLVVKTNPVDVAGPLTKAINKIFKQAHLDAKRRNKKECKSSPVVETLPTAAGELEHSMLGSDCA